MPWPKDRLSCTRCGRHRKEAGKISARGLCTRCRDLAMQANTTQITLKSGPYFDHWRTQMVHAVGALFADDA